MRFPLYALAFCLLAGEAFAVEAQFFRAVNANGPALTIDGNAWEASKGAKDFSISGTGFENQKVALKPPTDVARTTMIRSSFYGDKVDATFSNVPEGEYQLMAYVWEDNNNERFKILVNGQVVIEAFESGKEGMWKRLGPWKCRSDQGKVTLSLRGGAANLSGVELWRGSDPPPSLEGARFVTEPNADQAAFFESRIRPILAENCYECHSATAAKLKGGLLLDSRAGVVKGGDTGPAIAPGDADASLLIRAVRQEDKELRMPPKKKLAPEQIAALEQWVKMGAPDTRAADTVAAVKARTAIDWNKAREWWSFRPLTQPQAPAVRDTSWPTNDIDRFILARIESAGMKPAADAEKRALARRVTYDLTGLPPSPEQVEAFLTDNSSNAYSNMVERLLASPRYGERWGRFWLDVVRYADTAGDNSDFPIPQMHRYRDWVIAAFNSDMPYDRFVRAQIAGDVLPAKDEPERQQNIIATGYLANARRFGSRVDDYPQHLTIEDTIDNFGRAFLALTVNCSRCHDHKFDPITSQDYYGLYGIFHSTRYPWPGIELDQKQRDFVPLVAPAEYAAAMDRQKKLEGVRTALDTQVKKIQEMVDKQKGDEKKPFEPALASAKDVVKNFVSLPRAFETAYAMSDDHKHEDAAVQQKGDPAKSGQTVRRRFLTILGGAELPADDSSSGRGRLAEWVMDPANPLPARVMANRIWLHHFGKGIVPTPNDFGKQGKPATHPELLDWLASQLVSGKWSVKNLHRLILHSHTYRLSGARDADSISKDTNNDLLASFPRQRLDAESIRDTLLLLGGTLDLSPGGEHPFPPQNDWKFTQHNPFKAAYPSTKRSVYLMTQRIQRHPYLAIFDGADPSVSTPQRAASTTPLQALFLLNDPIVHEQSQRFAERVLKEAPDQPARIQRSYALLFSRPAEEDEAGRAGEFLVSVRAQLAESGTPPDRLEPESWAALTRVLFRLNEFVYLD